MPEANWLDELRGIQVEINQAAGFLEELGYAARIMGNDQLEGNLMVRRNRLERCATRLERAIGTLVGEQYGRRKSSSA